MPGCNQCREPRLSFITNALGGIAGGIVLDDPLFLQRKDPRINGRIPQRKSTHIERSRFKFWGIEQPTVAVGCRCNQIIGMNGQLGLLERLSRVISKARGRLCHVSPYTWAGCSSDLPRTTYRSLSRKASPPTSRRETMVCTINWVGGRRMFGLGESGRVSSTVGPRCVAGTRTQQKATAGDLP